MKHVILGDVHGNPAWKKAVEDQGTDADTHYVFVGDYFDSFTIQGKDQRVNFIEICAFKKDNPDNVTLLHGNHDFINYTYGESCSGYQYRDSGVIIELLQSNKELFQTAYGFNNYLVTHAGVTKTWFNKQGLKSYENAVEEINNHWEASPKQFGFNTTVRSDAYGDTVHNGPLWVRPNSLKKDRIDGFTQIVGHTTIPKIKQEEGVIFVDTDSNYYLVIDKNGLQTLPL